MDNWGDGIRLTDKWGYFDWLEPRLGNIQRTHPAETLIRTLRISLL